MLNWPNQKITLIAAAAIAILAVVSLALVSFNTGETSLQQFFLGAQNKPQPTPVPNQKVLSIIKEVLPNLSGRWAMAIKDLKTSQTYFYNQEERFASASLYKLAVMWATFDALEKGTLKVDQILTSPKSDLEQAVEGKQQPGDSPPRAQSPPPESEIISVSVAKALDAMITISDNYSAILLAESLGWQSIDNLMAQEGIEDIDLISSDGPYITAQATLDLLERIYRNTAVNQKASQQMKKLLFDQQINDRIPKNLPQDIKVGHKTGELDNLRHDAGIVLGQNSHYVFVFLSETSKPQEATEEIATLSQKIFDALEKND